MEVTREKLSDYCDCSRFRYAKNMIDIERIENGLAQDSLCEYQGKKWIKIDEDSINGCEYVKMMPLAKECEDPYPPHIFVNMARLSVEKNQENLILAISRLVAEGQDVYLYIGRWSPERKALETDPGTGA